MEHGRIAFTAIYLKASDGYVGFIEELPTVNSHGRTLKEVRYTLKKLAALLFVKQCDAEKAAASKGVVRESFTVPITQA